MTYTATLQTQTSLTGDSSPGTACKLLASITAVTGFTDRALFLFRRTGSGVVEYLGVCTAYDMASYIVDAPNSVTGFYRSISLSKVFANLAEAETATTDISNDIEALCKEMSRMVTLGAVSTVTISE